MSPIYSEHRIERLPSVIARTGLSRSSIYAMLSNGRFVKPVKLSARAMGFVSAEVDAWIAARVAARN